MKLFIVIMLTAFAGNAATKVPVENPRTAIGEKPKTKLEKTPKSLFLIKKAKINAEVGEPQFYPAEAQLRTVIYDHQLQNTKKFE
ncbi:MAG: hypothetical protein IT289_09265 [Oligoflexia bacterium]|nr:hypothetical protein [Oligoflexia bacterium]